jgi:hypothetical protein
VFDVSGIVDSIGIVLDKSVTAMLSMCMRSAVGCAAIAELLNGLEVDQRKKMTFNLFHHTKVWWNLLQGIVGDKEWQKIMAVGSPTEDLVMHRAEYDHFRRQRQLVPNVEVILERTTPLVLDSQVRAVYLSLCESKHYQYRLALSGMPAVDVLMWDHCARSGVEKGATWDCNFATKAGANVGCQATNGTDLQEITPTLVAIQKRCELLSTKVHWVVTDNHTCSKVNLIKNWGRVDRGLKWELEGNWATLSAIFPDLKQPLTDFFHITEAFDKPFPHRQWPVVFKNIHKQVWETCRSFDKGDIELFKDKCKAGSITLTFEFHGKVYTEATPFIEWEESGAWMQYNSKKHTICRSHSNTLEVFYEKLEKFRTAFVEFFLDPNGEGVPMCESGPAQPGELGKVAIIVASAAWAKGHLDKFEIRAPQCLPHPSLLARCNVTEQFVVGDFQGMPVYGRMFHTCGVENKNHRSTGIVASANTGVELSTATAVDFEMYDYRRQWDARSSRPDTDHTTPAKPVRTDDWESWVLASKAPVGVHDGYPALPMRVLQDGEHVSNVYRKIPTYLLAGLSTIEGAGKLAMQYHPPVCLEARPDPVATERSAFVPKAKAPPTRLKKQRAMQLATFLEDGAGGGARVHRTGDAVRLCGLTGAAAELNGTHAKVLSSAAKGAWTVQLAPGNCAAVQFTESQ